MYILGWLIQFMLAVPKETVSDQTSQGDPCYQLMVGKLYTMSSCVEGEMRIWSGFWFCNAVVFYTFWCMWSLAQERTFVHMDKPFEKAVRCEKTAYVLT